MAELSDDLMRELMVTFQAEAIEHVQTLNYSLLQLERATEEAARRELVTDAFRAAHSLKGSARAVNADHIAVLAHSMESVLQHARNTNTTIEVAVCDVLYGMLDAINAALGGQLVDVSAIQERLAAVTVGHVEPKAAAPVRGTAEDTPEEPSFRAISEDTIRVAITKLDTLMAQSGELVISRNSTQQRLMELQTIRLQMAQ